jgi:uncharacterized protein YggT (Ycf19 family)
MSLLAQLLLYALSLLFWLIIGRAVLTMLAGGRENFITGLFKRGTDPVFRLVRWVTPRFVPDAFIPLLSLLLLVLLRLPLLPLLVPER